MFRNAVLALCVNGCNCCTLCGGQLGEFRYLSLSYIVIILVGEIGDTDGGLTEHLCLRGYGVVLFGKCSCCWEGSLCLHLGESGSPNCWTT